MSAPSTAAARLPQRIPSLRRLPLRRRSGPSDGRVGRLLRGARTPLRIILVPVTVFLLASFLTFWLGSLGNFNPGAAVLGDQATPADIARINHNFGLDRPFLVQYGSWLGHAVTGDLGTSYFSSVPVSTTIAQALPVDLSIAALALAFAVVLGGGIGIAAALRQGSRFDRVVTLVTSALATVPPFIVGIALIVIFAVTLKVLPAGGWVNLADNPGQWLRFALLPSLALCVEGGAAIARQVRTSLVGALQENYVVGATARGLSRRRVVLRHALRNAAGPALTVIGLELPNLIGGAVVAEKIFALPGVAQEALLAGSSHNIPVIQGTLLVTIGVVLVANIAVNLALLWLNPQARRPRRLRSATVAADDTDAAAGGAA